MLLLDELLREVDGWIALIEVEFVVFRDFNIETLSSFVFCFFLRQPVPFA
jgi:hypothetical protein